MGCLLFSLQPVFHVWCSTGWNEKGIIGITVIVVIVVVVRAVVVAAAAVIVVVVAVAAVVVASAAAVVVVVVVVAAVVVVVVVAAAVVVASAAVVVVTIVIIVFIFDLCSPCEIWRVTITEQFRLLSLSFLSSSTGGRAGVSSSLKIYRFIPDNAIKQLVSPCNYSASINSPSQCFDSCFISP